MAEQFQMLFMAALCNRAGHYIFAVVCICLLSIFFSSDVYHTSTHGVALVPI